jgi:hypothetical protein
MGPLTGAYLVLLLPWDCTVHDQPSRCKQPQDHSSACEQPQDQPSTSAQSKDQVSTLRQFPESQVPTHRGGEDSAQGTLVKTQLPAQCNLAACLWSYDQVVARESR